MTQSINPNVLLPPPFPDHTQLPESDGTFVFAERAEGKNFQEHPQSLILTDSIGPVLQQLHPDGQYAIGQDCGIYWRETDPPEKGAEAPDWFYVPNVPPKLDGQIRRSYVIWREFISPLIALEFASAGLTQRARLARWCLRKSCSGNGDEERDKTPLSRSTEGELLTKPGKFWVYERIIGIPYYGIYEINSSKLEVYKLDGGRYQQLRPNKRGHYLIPPMGVELGLWQGSYQNQTQQWLRWWDEQGNLLLIGDERAELEQAPAQQERQRAQSAEQAQKDAIPRLLAMGLSVEQVAEALSLSVEEVRQVSTRGASQCMSKHLTTEVAATRTQVRLRGLEISLLSLRLCLCSPRLPACGCVFAL